MSGTSKFDKISFPGGYDITDIIVAVKLAARRHIENAPVGMLEGAIVQRFLLELAARHPESVPFRDPYLLRGQELFDERRSLLHSHLGLSWFGLAYWVYGLVAVRSRISIAEYDDLDTFLTPIRLALRELGVQVSAEECLVEVDRFLPAEVTARNVEASTDVFLSFVRFLHYSALRRRKVVTPGMALPSVCLAFTEKDAEEARSVTQFLMTHSISIIQQAAELTRTARLLVLLSRDAMDSELFWSRLADWKERPVVPMVVCLMPKADLYRELPAGASQEVRAWLTANLVLELSTETDRYVMLLKALDSSDPKQWWWNKGDAVELGLAVDVLGLGIPRRANRKASEPTGEPYPFAFDGSLLSACFFASDRLTRDETSGRDARYFAMCEDLLDLRQKANGEPYALPWFMLIYRAWLSFAGQLPGFAYSQEDVTHAERELQLALFALGVGTDGSEVPAFLDTFAHLPWATPPSTLAAVDERTIAFIVLVHHLTQAAVARAQRMRLQHPTCPSFVSYARSDEAFARELVAHLEAKGADVWWDLNSIALGMPLDGSLRAAVGDARFLLLIATPAADKSPYVRLELETAIRRGLRVIPISLDGQVPAGLQSVFDSAPDSIEPIISAIDSERASAPASALARLARSPADQLRWLQTQAPYQRLVNHLAQARASSPRDAAK
jgi:hypothetical protein